MFVLHWHNFNFRRINFFSALYELKRIDRSNDANYVTYSSSTSCNAHCVSERFALLHFFQLNEVKNYYGSVLDLVFSSKYNIIVKRSDEYILLEDYYHPTLIFETVLNPALNSSNLNYRFYDFNRAKNMPKLNNS